MLDADLNSNAAVENGEPTDWSPTLLVHVPTDETEGLRGGDSQHYNGLFNVFMDDVYPMMRPV